MSDNFTARALSEFKQDPNTSGILLVDKQIGVSSFDVIRLLRKETGITKMGHAGTLDPLASGLMIIGVNKATKELTRLLKLPKVYEAGVLVGVSTTTGDAEGEIVEEKDVPESLLEKAHVTRVCADLVGPHEVEVPRYSAVKVDGRPLYWYMRQGIEPSRVPIKTMTVQSVEIIKIDSIRHVVTLRIGVESGTYIRSLAEVFGDMLGGYPASLTSLRRTSIGTYSVQDAIVTRI